MSSRGIYGNTYNLRLPLRAIEEEFKALYEKEKLQFLDFNNRKLSGVEIVVKTGRKKKAEMAVAQAEARLCQSIGANSG